MVANICSGFSLTANSRSWFSEIPDEQVFVDLVSGNTLVRAPRRTVSGWEDTGSKRVETAHHTRGTNMAAITSPARGSSPLPARPHLRVVAPGERLVRRPTPATYRRRRLLAVGMVFAMLLLAKALVGWLGAGPLSAPGPAAGVDAQPVATSVYVARSGDTLWSIARRLQPEGDVRPLVQHLDAQVDGPLRAGQRLEFVPS